VRLFFSFLFSSCFSFLFHVKLEISLPTTPFYDVTKVPADFLKNLEVVRVDPSTYGSIDPNIYVGDANLDELFRALGMGIDWESSFAEMKGGKLDK
jgi:hypothetical protein